MLLLHGEDRVVTWNSASGGELGIPSKERDNNCLTYSSSRRRAEIPAIRNDKD